MHISRGRVFFIVAAVAVYFGWQNLSRSAHETVVLHIPAVNNQDTYTVLWVVEDARTVWIRAENPRRLWLEHLREGPVIELRRGGSTRSYRATVFDNADARSYVDPMFRRKYGLSDQVHAVLTQRDSVPIRLDRP